MAKLELSIPDEIAKKFQRAVNSKQWELTKSSTVGKTVTHLAVGIQNIVREQTNLSQKWARRVIVAQKPRGFPAEGSVTVRDQPVPLVAFAPKQTAGGVTVTPTKGMQPLVFRHAFLATMPNQHEGVFERGRHLPTGGANAENSAFQMLRVDASGRVSGTSPPPGEKKFGFNAEGFVGRLTIQELMGPSVYDLVKIPETLKKVEEDGRAFMMKTLRSQMARFAAGDLISDSEGAD